MVLQGTMAQCTACALRRGARRMPVAQRTAQSGSGRLTSTHAAPMAQVLHCTHLPQCVACKRWVSVQCLPLQAWHAFRAL
jgi:hypothetical protein